MGGAVMQWLRDEVQLLPNSKEAGLIAASVPDTGGVYLVPAFAGLGAPHWDMYARGALVGMTRGTGRAQIIRAAEEAIAYQNCDLVAATLAVLALDWHTQQSLCARPAENVFEPSMGDAQRQRLLAGWRKAVARASRWEDADATTEGQA